MFITYFIVKEYKYSPLFYCLYHKDDVEELNNIKKRNLRLFGNELNECCVCYEKTVKKTICKHNLCFKCYLKLEQKSCPLCRKELENSDQYEHTIIHYSSL